MEYLFILAFQIAGVIVHVTQKIKEFDIKYPEKTRKEIRGLFYENEWSSLGISASFLLVHLLIHGAADYYKWFGDFQYIQLFGWNLPVTLVSLGLAFMVGYAGQRWIYKYLGNLESVLDKGADKIK